MDHAHLLGEQLYLDFEDIFRKLQAYLINVFAVVESLLSTEISSSPALRTQLIALTKELMKITDRSCHVSLCILPQKSSIADERLLVQQQYRCAGCGEVLQKTFLGLPRAKLDYAPCRHHGGLFCKRWCHSGTRLAIPLAYYRPDTDESVCDQSGTFYYYGQASTRLIQLAPAL